MSMKLKSEPWTPDSGEKLSKKELERAMNELNLSSFRKLERGFTDPVIPNQNIALFSYEPCDPNNKYGLFAFAKIRGVFSSEFEANQYARKIIKNFDSVNEIHHVRVGHPFPVGIKFHGEYDNVILNEELEKAQNAIKVKTEEREIEETRNFEQRKQQLFEDVDPDKTKSQLELYLTQRQKYAHIAVLYEEYREQLERMKGILQKTYLELTKLETPEILETYQDEYDRKKKECGLDKDSSVEGRKIKKFFETLPLFDFLKTNNG